MILEGLVTTRNDDGTPHLAPMGPIFHCATQSLVLRPFETSTTGKNLLRTGQGVFHTTDDVLLLTLAALGRVNPFPEHTPARCIDGMILADYCNAYEFEIFETDTRQERYRLNARIAALHELRRFLGFNRAKHAVLEAAIHATRFFLIEHARALEDYERFQVIVDKTGGEQEQLAMKYLWQHFRDHYDKKTLT